MGRLSLRPLRVLAALGTLLPACGTGPCEERSFFGICPTEGSTVPSAGGEPAPALVSMSPEPGQEDFFFLSPFEWRWSRAVSGVEVELLDEVGDSLRVEVRVSANGRDVTATVVPALVPDRAYRLTLRWDAEVAELDFRTGLTGLPLSDPRGLAGGAWLFDLGLARRVGEPTLVGTLVVGGLDPSHLLLRAGARPDPAAPFLPLLLAWVRPTDDGDIEPTCVPGLSATGEVPRSWQNPHASVGPSDLATRFVASPTVLYGTTLDFWWTPDGSAVGHARLRGLLDTRPQADISDSSSTFPGCEGLEELFGLSCEPCPDGVVACYTVDLDGLSGSPVKLAPGPFRFDNGCETVLALRDTVCVDEAAALDPDGDGFYQGCPEFYQ